MAVYELNDTLPWNPEVLGQAGSDGHPFVVDGDYDQVMTLVIEEARKAGDNTIKVTTPRKPFFARQPVPSVVASVLLTDSALIDPSGEHKKLTAQWLVSVCFSPFRIALTGGYTKSFGHDPSIPYLLNDYYNHLKNNYHVPAEATRFAYRKLGLGMEFVQFKASNETDDSFR